MSQHKPVIGITMGDAAGVGPEIILKSLMNEEMYHISHPVVIGDVKILERAKTFVGSDLTIEAITADELGQVDYRFGTVHVLDLDLAGGLADWTSCPGSRTRRVQILETAIELAKDHKIQAICTAPLNKEALHKGVTNIRAIRKFWRI